MVTTQKVLTDCVEKLIYSLLATIETLFLAFLWLAIFTVKCLTKINNKDLFSLHMQIFFARSLVLQRKEVFLYYVVGGEILCMDCI